MHLIFEETTSPLYYSNDGRLRLVEQNFTGKGKLSIYVLRLHDADGEPVEDVFCTYDRVKADAYIAGYDLATSAR